MGRYVNGHYVEEEDEKTFTVTNAKGEKETHQKHQGFVDYHLSKPGTTREELRHAEKIKNIRRGLGSLYKEDE